MNADSPRAKAVCAMLPIWLAGLGDRLHSVVLFGSVARGTDHGASDVDLLLVAEGLPHALRDRRRPFLDAFERTRAELGLPAVDWNLVVKTPEEAVHHSPLYLDMVEDAVILHDRDGEFARVLASMRNRMRELGSHRVFLDDGSWYWVLADDARVGKEIEL